MANLDKRLHAYIRVDGSGRSVPTSLILRKSKPKVGKWIEVDTVFQCCNGTTTTTTSSTTIAPICATYFLSAGRGGGLLTYTDCESGTMEIPLPPFTSLEFCALLNTPVFAGDGIVFLIAMECLITTTTTTTIEPTTTTTTTEEPPTTTSTTTEEETTTTTTTLFVPSDERLKENIRPTGNMIGEFNEYTWNWNEEAKTLGFDLYPNRGVIAQEVMYKCPEAVILDSDGYYKVNYNKI